MNLHVLMNIAKQRMTHPLRWIWLLPLVSLSAHAEQYRSEQRIVETPTAAETPAQDPKKLLQQTTDPYAKALLLRDMAATAADRKDFAGAAKLLEQALAQNALSGFAANELRGNLAQLYMASGNYKKVLPQLEQQAKAANAPPEVLIALGAAYTELNRPREAIPLMRRAIAASKNPDPTWKRALLTALLATGQEKEALPLLEQAVRDDPRDREAWLRLCALQLKFGGREKALGYLELASRLGYLQDEKDRLRLVQLTSQMGAPFQAGSLLQSWMKGKQVGNSAENWKFLASLWVAAREQSLALPALDQAITLAPDAQLYQTRANVLLQREQYGAAAESLQRAIAMGGKSGPTLMSLALARYQQADVEGALSAFREATQFAASKKTASDWIKYLESGEARTEALKTARERGSRIQDDVQLSDRLTGATVQVSVAERARAAAVTGEPYTPVGAERPGNGDGAIPAWTGGFLPSEKPASHRAGGLLPDPFPNDRPQYTITVSNLAEHTSRLTRGHQVMLRKYPGYRIPVYETRRTASFPQPIYDATLANKGKARLLGSDSLEGARLGFPFMRPQSGVEIMWNHRVRYRGDTVQANYAQRVMDNGQLRQRNREFMKVMFRYGSLKDPVDIAQKNILLYGITSISEGPRAADFVALFHETADSIKSPRNIWVLIVKLGKLLRIPPVGYDQPFPGSEALQFIDMVDMYNGAFDRYVWKLTGKKELIIPYNGYRASDGSMKYEQLMQPRYLNPDALRYELHRVWVIEATERGGKSHAFGKRIFYVDEDSWNVVLVENEDRDGNLWRFQEGHLVQLYDLQAMTAMPSVTYDLKDGRYFVTRLFSEEKNGFQYNIPMKESEFYPSNVQAKYTR